MVSNFRRITAAQHLCNSLVTDEGDGEKDIVEVDTSVTSTLAEWRNKFKKQQVTVCLNQRDS